MESGTNIAIIHDVIFQEVIQQGLGHGHLDNGLYLPHQMESANLGGAGIITTDHFLKVWNRCCDPKSTSDDQDAFIMTDFLNHSMRAGEQG
jgi:hypothetical protein